MARRPIEVKQRRKAIKALRRTPPAFFDLVQWLIDHKHAKTKKQAREIILAGRVKSDSHPLGIAKAQQVATPGLLGSVKVEIKDVVDPYVPVERKQNIIVSAAA